MNRTQHHRSDGYGVQLYAAHLARIHFSASFLGTRSQVVVRCSPSQNNAWPGAGSTLTWSAIASTASVAVSPALLTG